MQNSLRRRRIMGVVLKLTLLRTSSMPTSSMFSLIIRNLSILRPSTSCGLSATFGAPRMPSFSKVWHLVFISFFFLYLSRHLWEAQGGKHRQGISWGHILWVLQAAPGVHHSKGFRGPSWIAADYHRGVPMDWLEMFDWLSPDARFC